jgi:hypothetical protein
LLSKICQQTERTQLANEASHKVISLNPFLFQSFTDLCNRGEKPDPAQIFQLTSTDIFQNSQCRQNFNALAWHAGGGGGFITTTTLDNSNNSFIINNSSDILMNNSNSNSNNNSYSNLNILSTPLDQISQQQQQQLPPHQTPNNNVSIANAMRGMGGVGVGGVIDDSTTPLYSNQSNSGELQHI